MVDTRKNILFSLLSMLAWVSLNMDSSRPAQAQMGVNPMCQTPDRSMTSGKASGCEPRLTGQKFLTVVGQGRVTAPADTALLEFSLLKQESGDANNNSPQPSPQVAQPAIDPILLPIVDALLKSGVVRRNITVQTKLAQSIKLFVTLEKPTQERMQQVVQVVNQSLKSTPQLALQNISAGYGVTTCQALERSARRLALQDAQNQLLTLAQDVQVPLGELLSVVVMPFVGGRTTLSCGSKVAVPASPFGQISTETLPPYDPSELPEVQLSSQVSVTHAIGANPEPTARP